ncbi:integrase catalytic domain-containing protein [Trichonephila clavata]|uniref:Integrase catalytic domain-containing protein n=1 Tax=Trichonephila clavata TaxID=2740835 RepID=A0A8X6K0Q2_TRICU|nr:integrase catalytic domain-containing protein [Trichonephila clavata]
MKNEVESVALHSFSDSSKRGYGCVIYLRIVCKNGTIGTSFVASKSRVSPLKAVSLPRLELLGALLSVKLASRIAKIFKYECGIHYWTDSTIVYCWVRSRDRFKRFVKNRVEEIQKLSTPSDWHHCPKKENPAEFLTRGLSVKNLKKCDAWGNGTHWLHQPEENWPKSEVEGVEEKNLELRRKSEKTIQNQCILEPNDYVLDLKKYSSLNKVLRVTAWILRFLTNSRRNNIKASYLHANEIERAELYWIKETQREIYSSEIFALKKQQPIRQDSKIRSLVPFLDSQDILRISTRLEEADLVIGEKQPILLPAKSKFTELLVMKEHITVFHSGVSATLTQIRRKFWIPKARQLVKRIIRNCVVCRKYAAKPANQITAQLPRDRIVESHPL